MSGRVTKRDRGQFMDEVHFRGKVRFWRWLYEATDTAVWAWINRPRIGDVKPSPTAAVFKPRDHFKADGTPKAKLTQAQAERHCEMESKARCYECSVCGAWHIGHKTHAKLKVAC